MKPQIIFDKVVRHLFKQNKKCVDPETKKCLYRGPNNTKCAIGALIPDSIYEDCMENKRASVLIGRFERVGDIIKPENCSLADSLQQVHDEAKMTKKNTFDKKHLRSSLENVAKHYNLSTKVLSEV